VAAAAMASGGANGHAGSARARSMNGTREREAVSARRRLTRKVDQLARMQAMRGTVSTAERGAWRKTGRSAWARSRGPLGLRSSHSAPWSIAEPPKGPYAERSRGRHVDETARMCARSGRHSDDVGARLYSNNHRSKLYNSQKCQHT
jgi:hypothetical protein